MKDRALKGTKAHQDHLGSQEWYDGDPQLPIEPCYSRGVIQPNQSMKIFKVNQRFSIWIDSEHVESHTHEVSKINVLSL
jgi:hypothetical protein